MSAEKVKTPATVAEVDALLTKAADAWQRHDLAGRQSTAERFRTVMDDLLDARLRLVLPRQPAEEVAHVR